MGFDLGFRPRPLTLPQYAFERIELRWLWCEDHDLDEDDAWEEAHAETIDGVPYVPEPRYNEPAVLRALLARITAEYEAYWHQYTQEGEMEGVEDGQGEQP